jgi:alpha-tubulin suppressor-like RCC1 family protein
MSIRLIFKLQKVRYLVDHDVDLKFVECGDSHTVTVSKSGECYAWGNSDSGRLGVVVGGSEAVSDVEHGAAMRHILLPQLIGGLNGIPIHSVACGSAHTLFVTEDQRLYATGCNICGQVRPLHSMRILYSTLLHLHPSLV